MNFANRLISKITTILSFVLVFIQAYLSLYMHQKDLAVFITSLVFIPLVLVNLIYQLVLYKKYRPNYQMKLVENELKTNLLVSTVALFFSVLTFALAYAAYLYLLFY